MTTTIPNTTKPNTTMPLTTKPLTTKPLTTNPLMTNTNTTKPFTTTPSLTKCNGGTPPKYTSLRKDNIDKIKLYYNKLLDEYTKAYTEYSTNKNSTIVSDREDAEAILKPRAEAYNTQIINLSKELIESVDKDTDLILQQKTELEEKQQTIDTLLNNIKMLKVSQRDSTISEQARNDSLTITKTGSDELQFTSHMYMAFNILLVILVIGFIIYLVYSNGNTMSNTNQNSINSIYKNIKTNN